MDVPRFFPNPYEKSLFDDILDGNQYKEELLAKVKALSDTLFGRLEDVIQNVSSYRDHQVYTGYSGIAYLCLHEYKKTNDNKYLQYAKDLTDRALRQLDGRDISFMLGDAGPLTLGTIIYSKLQDNDQCRTLIKRLLELPQTARRPPYEILYGYAGYLYALLLLNKELGPIIPGHVIQQTARKILEDGRNSARLRKSPAPLYYEWYYTNYLGAAHGVAGILYILLCASEYLSQNEIEQLIIPTIDWLTTQRFPDGNFKANDGRDVDSLVHWCHGAPGVVFLYLLASKILNRQHYLDIAKECGEVVWSKGLLKKGYSICHGVSGNAYTFLQLYKYTKDESQLKRAACFADWCTTYPDAEGHKPDAPYSLFEGIAGLQYFLSDMQDPLNASFPAFALD